MPFFSGWRENSEGSKTKNFVYFVISVTALHGIALGQPACQKRLLDSAKICLVKQLYSRANASLKKVLQLAPDNAEASYLLVASEQTRILDYESYSIDADAFVERADATRKVLLKSLGRRHGEDSLQCAFYIGNIEGGISVMQAKVGNWPAAIKNGASSINVFKSVIEATPDYYPAYLGLGVFNYYISQNLGWLPFFDDRRKEGMEQIRLSTKAEFPYSYVAKNSLCWILIERNEYGAADSIASSVLDDLPANTIFIRLKARIAFWRKDVPQAMEWARKLVAISEGRIPVNWSDFLSGYQILVSENDALGRKDECLACCRKVLRKPVPELYRRIPYVKKYLDYIAEIQSKYTK